MRLSYIRSVSAIIATKLALKLQSASIESPRWTIPQIAGPGLPPYHGRAKDCASTFYQVVGPWVLVIRFAHDRWTYASSPVPVRALSVPTERRTCKVMGLLTYDQSVPSRTNPGPANASHYPFGWSPRLREAIIYQRRWLSLPASGASFEHRG